MIKIAKISENLFQVDDNELPISITEVRQIANGYGGLDNIEASKWIDELEEKGEHQLEAKANKGVVVNMYEVDYPPPQDPNKESQQVVKYLDEYDDAISQQVFPGVETKDVVVDLHKNLEKRNVNKLQWQIEPTLNTLEELQHFVSTMEVNKLYDIKGYPYKIKLDYENPYGYDKTEMFYTWSLERKYDILGSSGYIFPTHGQNVVFWKKRSTAERSLFNKLSWLYDESTGMLENRFRKKLNWRVKLLKEEDGN
ncbi:MAG: hypothetical protein M0R03_14505 [Novosphingobium sp.]|nr:hypothetical protein [Novosphingobium sp.]